jgi:hypothetical protein
MEHETRRLDLGLVLAAAAVIAVVVAIWATGALAAGGSGSSGSNDVQAGLADPFVQAQDRGQSRSRDDCPEHDGGGGNQAPEGSSGSGGSNDV